MSDSLVETIASSLAEWEIPHVELAIYGSADPEHIARQLRAACAREMREDPRNVLLYRSSIGAVAGLELASGHRIIVKAHQPAMGIEEHLSDVVKLQGTIESQLRLAPRVLAGPFRFANGHAIIEEFVDRGQPRDGHDPTIRCEIARSLHAIIECLDGASPANLRPAIVLDQNRATLWPQSHSKLFDFATTRAGAEYIETIATLARSRMMRAGREIVGHSDWRAEHVRFRGDIATVGFDWDSLCLAYEPALIGATAHMFCADFALDNHTQAPTIDEARAFVANYEDARGGAFTSRERQLCAATFAYALAYTCRCAHAAGVDSRGEIGTFQHLLATEGVRLLDL